jgi:hypothetical protein
MRIDGGTREEEGERERESMLLSRIERRKERNSQSRNECNEKSMKRDIPSRMTEPLPKLFSMSLMTFSSILFLAVSFSFASVFSVAASFFADSARRT